jgi:hypothetical protein
MTHKHASAPLASARKGASHAKLVFLIVGRTFSLTILVYRQARKPDLRNTKRSSAAKGPARVIILEKANQS